jgi:hypothetical protein
MIVSMTFLLHCQICIRTCGQCLPLKIFKLFILLWEKWVLKFFLVKYHLLSLRLMDIKFHSFNYINTWQLLKSRIEKLILFGQFQNSYFASFIIKCSNIHIISLHKQLIYVNKMTRAFGGWMNFGDIIKRFHSLNLHYNCIQTW